MSIVSSGTYLTNRSVNSSLQEKILNRSQKRVTYAHVHSVRTILEKFFSSADKKPFYALILALKNNDVLDEHLLVILSQVNECVSMLTEDVRPLVDAILSIKWLDKSKPIVREYQSFIVDLLSAHNYYTKATLSHLVLTFHPKDESEWVKGRPSKSEFKKYFNVHYVINYLLNFIPMCGEVLLELLETHYPYFKKPAHSHEVYLHNLLWILDYQPRYRVEILSMIFKNLIQLDLHASRDELEKYDSEMEDDTFSMDLEDAVRAETRHPIGYTLDVCMLRLFQFIYSECYDDVSESASETTTCDESTDNSKRQTDKRLNWDKSKSFYADVIHVFEKFLLTSQGTSHVQFAVFYLCSFKVQLADAFTAFLWNCVTNPSSPQVYRQSAVSYMASFLARCSFMPISLLYTYLDKMTKWIHSYIANQDSMKSLNADIRTHLVFYYVCQSLFYVIAFRHKDLVLTNKGLQFLQSLNLAKIVTCHLNPLKACAPAIARNFGAITRTYQLAYCFAIIESNARNTVPLVYKDKTGHVFTMDVKLESFFPFDPYLLKRSAQHVTPIYLEYQSADDRDTHDGVSKMDQDEDDFLTETPKKSENHELFSYSTSPGFKGNF